MGAWGTVCGACRGGVCVRRVASAFQLAVRGFCRECVRHTVCRRQSAALSCSAERRRTIAHCQLSSTRIQHTQTRETHPQQRPLLGQASAGAPHLLATFQLRPQRRDSAPQLIRGRHRRASCVPPRASCRATGCRAGAPRAQTKRGEVPASAPDHLLLH